MVPRVLMLSIFFSSTFWGAEVMSYLFKGKKTDVTIEDYKQTMINDVCAEKIGSCTALRKLEAPLKTFTSQEKNYMSPEDSYCKALSGTTVVLRAKDQKEYAFCLFSDVTMVSSVSLYKAYVDQENKREVASVKKGSDQ